MSESTDAPTKSKNPEHYSFMDRDALAKYTTDTGKILPQIHWSYSHAATQSVAC